MTPDEFGAPSASPRCALSARELHEFHATIADVTDEHHQNMPGLLQPEDFNADVVVRFLRHNGIEANAREDGAFRYKLADPAREKHLRFACVCLCASISYAIEAAYWCIEAKR